MMTAAVEEAARAAAEAIRLLVLENVGNKIYIALGIGFGNIIKSLDCDGIKLIIHKGQRVSSCEFRYKYNLYP